MLFRVASRWGSKANQSSSRRSRSPGETGVCRPGGFKLDLRSKSVGKHAVGATWGNRGILSVGGQVGYSRSRQLNIGSLLGESTYDSWEMFKASK